MKRIITLSLCLLSLSFVCVLAQSNADRYVAMKKVSVIIDNDFCGDPDGLFQLAHSVLSPSCDIKGIVGAHLNERGGFSSADGGKTAEESCKKVKELLDVMGLSGEFKVVAGSNNKMTNPKEPQISEGARLIVEEAMKASPKKPLYVLVGGPLTDIASAWLMKPEISKNIVLVWIGGQEYTGLDAVVPPGYSTPEYNLNLSIAAARTVFNDSDISIWQIPRDVYRQCLYGMSELELRVRPFGKTGAYLYNSLASMMNGMKSHNYPMGETYILGDSPLVLMTALQSGFESDPSSSQYKYVQSPLIAEDGSYRFNHSGRLIRVYTHIDTRLMFADMEAKLQLHAEKGR